MDESKAAGVYQILAPSGKRYIGSTKGFARRWATHKYLLRRNKHPCAGLQNAFRKYGEANLSFEVIEACAVDDRFVREQSHIDRHPRQQLYNARMDVVTNLGLKPSAATRAAMSAAHKRLGAKRTEEHKAIISRTHRGKINSDATRKRISTSKSSTGIEGVQRLTCRNAWVARVFADGVRHHLGQYPTAEAAQAAREAFLADPAGWLAAKPKRLDSGFRGVCYDKARRKYRASYRGQYLGLFETPELANEARTAYLASVTLPATAPEPAT